MMMTAPTVFGGLATAHRQYGRQCRRLDAARRGAAAGTWPLRRDRTGSFRWIAARSSPMAMAASPGKRPACDRSCQVQPQPRWTGGRAWPDLHSCIPATASARSQKRELRAQEFLMTPVPLPTGRRLAIRETRPADGGPAH
jgi:hypothetical protein